MPRKPPKPLSGPDYTPNRSRIDISCPPVLRELLVDAATVSYESLTGFILHAAYERARQLIRDRERLDEAEEALRRLPYVRL
jgi:uncharacterized protein (DUF1778 family)